METQECRAAIINYQILVSNLETTQVKNRRADASLEVGYMDNVRGQFFSPIYLALTLLPRYNIYYVSQFYLVRNVRAVEIAALTSILKALNILKQNQRKAWDPVTIMHWTYWRLETAEKVIFRCVINFFYWWTFVQS